MIGGGISGALGAGYDTSGDPAAMVFGGLGGAAFGLWGGNAMVNEEELGALAAGLIGLDDELIGNIVGGWGAWWIDTLFGPNKS
jgi:hypothetical protein